MVFLFLIGHQDKDQPPYTEDLSPALGSSYQSSGGGGAARLPQEIRVVEGSCEDSSEACSLPLLERCPPRVSSYSSVHPRMAGRSRRPLKSPNNIVLSLNLIRAAQRELQFLCFVNRHPALYKGQLVKKAIER